MTPRFWYNGRAWQFCRAYVPCMHAFAGAGLWAAPPLPGAGPVGPDRSGHPKFVFGVGVCVLTRLRLQCLFCVWPIRALLVVYRRVNGGVKNKSVRVWVCVEGLLEEVLVFVRRVAGSACGHPAAEVKGNLDLLALVVKDILASAVEWQ